MPKKFDEGLIKVERDLVGVLLVCIILRGVYVLCKVCVFDVC